MFWYYSSSLVYANQAKERRKASTHEKVLTRMTEKASWSSENEVVEKVVGEDWSEQTRWIVPGLFGAMGDFNVFGYSR